MIKKLEEQQSFLLKMMKKYPNEPQILGVYVSNYNIILANDK